MLKRTHYCTLHKRALVRDCAIEKITVHATEEDEIRFCYYKPNALGNPQLIMRPPDVPEEHLLQMFVAAVAEGIFTDNFREELKRVL